MPDLGSGARHLWQQLQDAGLTGHGGMGRVPLSWADLRAWQLGTGQRLPPWQLRALRQASAAWQGEHLRAANPDAPAPWSVALCDEQRSAVRNKVRAVFGALARDPNPAARGQPRD